jgi:hypothetical protein
MAKEKSMTKEQIMLYLNEKCTLLAPEGAAKGTGLREIWSMIFNNGKIINLPKPDVVNRLAEWYADKQNIIDVWNGVSTGLIDIPGLSDIEKEFIAIYVQRDGDEFTASTKAIAQKHKITPPEEKNNYYSRYSDFYSSYNTRYLRFLHLIINQYPKTKAVCLFPGGKEIPPFILPVLKEIISPWRFEYPEYKPAKTDHIICREHRTADFAGVVRFAGSEKLKVKEGTFDITKAKLAKMALSIGFDEVCDNNGQFCTPKDATHTNHFMVALPLFLLAMNSELIEVNEDLSVIPKEEAVAFLSRPMHEVARDLFNEYLRSGDICETHYITSIALSNGEDHINWNAVRFPILRLLQSCPVGQFISYAEFERNALIACGGFFNDQVYGQVYVRGYSSSYYGRYTPDWSECEAQIIRLILSFCGALGVLDIAYTERIKGFKFENNDFHIGISGFRITPLGAWILKLKTDYDAPATVLQSADGELIVQPDHTVMISGLRKRIEHEIYLSNCLSKVSLDDNVAIYKIDFAGIVKAFDQNITPLEIKTYLEIASDKPLPENVQRSFDDWHTKVGRVKIRNVTVLETDDELLLQELIHIKSMDKYTSDVLKHAVVIKDDVSKKKVKSLSEKNGWLVKL